MSDKRTGVRFGLRIQVMLTIFIVALIEAGISLYFVYDAHVEASRGAFLVKHYNRFDAYRRGLGQALAGNAALSGRGLTVAGTMGTPRFSGTARELTDALAATSSPDLVLVVDARGHAIAGPGLADLEPSETAQSRLIRDVLGGMTIAGELAVIGGHVYSTSAVPIEADVAVPPATEDAEPTSERQTVGAIVLGTRFERIMEDYGQQSDPNPTKQHLLTLVGKDDIVLASVFPEDEHGRLATALIPENWSSAREGDGEVAIIDMGDHIFDFHHDDDVRGYRGNEYGDIGSIFLMRQRDFKARNFSARVESSFLALIGFALLTLVIGWMLAFWITRRIRRYVSATEDLAKGRGDLTKRLRVDRRDELGRLAENLNAVFAYTHDLAARVQHAAFQVGASSAEISAASRQMLEGAREQAKKTEGSTAAVTELSASIQQVAENATEATRVARSSGDAVSKAIDRMNEIRSTVDEAAARIHDLGESGKRIGNIVEVIRQISDQTTLLALNAAIEAAHAGEQGRGFAVVADEVSGLANRVGQSARDIEDLIATIKEQTIEAVRAMEAGTREVEEGTKLVTSTLADLQMLVGVVEDTAQAVQEQAVASDEIARNMDVVQRIAQDVLSSSEEAVDQGEHLHRLAHGLEESVKGFRIAASAEGAIAAKEGPPQLGSGD
ncbi:MAG: methyl-accepting chemotaxis protein [Myxococcota bacterium]